MASGLLALDCGGRSTLDCAAGGTKTLDAAFVRSGLRVCRDADSVRLGDEADNCGECNLSPIDCSAVFAGDWALVPEGAVTAQRLAR